MTFHQSSSRHTHQRWLRIVKDTDTHFAHWFITMKPYRWMWSHLGLTLFQAIVVLIYTAISTQTILTRSTYLRIYYLKMMTVAVLISLNSLLLFNPTLHTYWLWRHLIQAWQANFRSLYWVWTTSLSIALVSIYTSWIISTEAENVEIVCRDHKNLLIFL
jgi:hypothetical protein